MKDELVIEELKNAILDQVQEQLVVENSIIETLINMAVGAGSKRFPWRNGPHRNPSKQSVLVYKHELC